MTRRPRRNHPPALVCVAMLGGMRRARPRLGGGNVLQLSEQGPSQRGVKPASVDLVIKALDVAEQEEQFRTGETPNRAGCGPAVLPIAEGAVGVQCVSDELQATKAAGVKRMVKDGQFPESDQVIGCDCSNYWVCAHTGPLKIELAIQRLGGEFDFYSGRAGLSEVVYCSRCGKHRPTFRLGWKTTPATYTGAPGAGAVVRSVLTPPAAAPSWSEPEDWLTGGSNLRRFGPRR